MQKIDFVVTWVDGNDPVWLASKEKYAKEADITLNSKARYRDWKIFKYWFRAIEKNASWVNKIFLITEGHLPDWINLEHPKLVHIRHSDYIASEFLPTFSANPIEWNYHNIDGLSRYFVNFNDDMFINAEVSPEDFFINGVPRDCGIFSPIVPNPGGIASMVLNNLEIINKNFSQKQVIQKNFFKFFNLKYGKHLIKNFCTLPWKPILGFYDNHIPISYDKKYFEKVWEKEEYEIKKTCSHKFRQKDDITHWLVRYWQLCDGNFVPRDVNWGRYYNISSEIKDICTDIENSYHKVICLNDGDEIKDFEYFQHQLINSFEKNTMKNLDLKNNRRILQIGCENFGKGGRSVIIYNLTEPLKNTFSIDFLATGKVSNRSYFKKLEERNGKIIEYVPKSQGLKLFKEFHRSISLIALFKKNHYDLIHINADDAWEAIKSYILVKIANRKQKVIFHAHAAGNLTHSSFLKTAIIKLSKFFLLKVRSIKLACSNDAAKYMYHEKDNVFILNNGIDTQKYIFNNLVRKKIRNELCLEDKDVLIGTIGRLEDIKNPFFCLEIIRHLKLKYKKNIKYIWIGDGQLMDKMKSLISEYKLENTILLLGHKDNISDYIQALDLFILASYKEGFGLVNLEAQASGMPCIVSTGIPQHVKVNENFFYLDLSLGAEKWCDFILNLEIKRTSENIREKFIAYEFDLSNNSNKLREFYCRALNDE
ncbi:Stealth CR1 domain-containing protein [Actinobacillus equuli]|uniref:Stealth CR1 domain-containing protein n=1 Tax=Actinobacillus equuli TaxID=718 RepID=UPI002442C203|nr:Stealth CR1 domain-containing protein [Actinobacillus equuli]WGE57044.1 Stealth CR1 domain-containing protein [Actinobacillus equuli subsp. equuli]